MTILIDPPQVPGHGRLWSHLASDESYAELHDFARAAGIPARGFDRDHYDVPAEYYARMVSAGAVPVSSRELTVRLVGAGLRRRKTPALRPRRAGRELAQPPLLRPGDRVAVVSPAGPAEASRLAAGVEVLRGWELDVVPAHGLEPTDRPWLAGSDESRAGSLSAAWTDPGVRAVFCARGGFGSQRLLGLLDWSALSRAGATWLVGFSDVTALHQAFAAELGVATAHGPGVASLATAHPDAVESLRALLFEGTVERLAGRPARGGVAVGPLVGGNVAILASSAGTPGVRPARDSIALLEDVAEAPYRIDRMLTQLARSGWLDGVRGIACGAFSDCGDADEVRALLRDRLGGLEVPMVLDLPVGHVDANRSVMLGRRARLDGATGILTQEIPGFAAR